MPWMLVYTSVYCVCISDQQTTEEGKKKSKCCALNAMFSLFLLMTVTVRLMGHQHLIFWLIENCAVMSD